MNTTTQSFFEVINCPICNTATFDVVRPAQYEKNITEEDFRKLYSASSDSVLLDQVVKCSGCQLIYVNPRIDSQILMQGYSEAVDPRFVAQNPERIDTFRRVLSKICGKQGVSPSKDKRVLDVGCAGGSFPKAANDLGFTVTGVEPSTWLANYGRTQYGLDIRTGILQEDMFPPATFHLISMWDVIEHLTDPQGVLKTIRTLLRDDGLLIVNYPDVGSFVAKSMGFKWPFWLSVHLIYYTRTTMKLQLEKAGFEVVQSGVHWQKLKLSYLLYRASHYIPVAGFFKKIVDALGMGNIGATYNMGQTLIVARKKK